MFHFYGAHGMSLRLSNAGRRGKSSEAGETGGQICGDSGIGKVKRARVWKRVLWRQEKKHAC